MAKSNTSKQANTSNVQAAPADSTQAQGSQWSNERSRIFAGEAAGARFVALAAVLRDMADKGKRAPTFGEVAQASADYTKGGKAIQRTSVGSWRTLVQRGKQCGALPAEVSITETGFDLSAVAASEAAPTKASSKAPTKGKATK